KEVHSTAVMRDLISPDSVWLGKTRPIGTNGEQGRLRKHDQVDAAGARDADTRAINHVDGNHDILIAFELDRMQSRQRIARFKARKRCCASVEECTLIS